MQLPYAVWSLIILALIGANIPFLNQRLFALIRLKNSSYKKSFWLRLVELALFYCVLGGVAYLLEANIGNVFTQTWEFFAITVCLFIVFAFPGFVYQYLRRQ